MLLSGADIGGRLYQPQYHIAVLNGTLRRAHHILVQLVLCPVDSGGIKENDLPPVIGVDCLNPVSGGLRTRRGDGDLLSDQMVHQRGLSDIRTADQCNKP